MDTSVSHITARKKVSLSSSLGRFRDANNSVVLVQRGEFVMILAA